ncbi:MAG TPA: glutathione S-transferase family protein, partial [Phenylobacterium sp.]|nr:glutathione S-transferase family protein [Phenylobacterium sp.]
AAIEARQMDGIFDDYVQAPMSQMVFNLLREEARRDPYLADEAHGVLDRSYAWLDRWMTGREWAVGAAFGIADCAAAAALFYAHWAYPIPEACTALRAYRSRLLARPSVARVVEEARPWRENFPLKGDRSPD